MPKNETLIKNDLELWQACLAKYNRYMVLAQASLAGIQATLSGKEAVLVSGICHVIRML